MKVLCYGSLNIDYVYKVPHFVSAGETLSSTSLATNPGGKGANQATALSKAGCETYMAGKIGKDGLFLLDVLSSAGVNHSFVNVTDKRTGHAIIQLDSHCQNSILLYPGENRNITEEEIDKVLSEFSSSDWLVLQNEINNLPLIITKAKKIGMKICLNPAPFDESIFSLPLSDIDYLIVNEVEGAGLCGHDGLSYEEILDELKMKFPQSAIVMTVGENGSYYQKGSERIYQECIKCEAKDTTAAGDTFIGYFIASLIKGYQIRTAMKYAAVASSIAVSREGAIPSVPYAEEVFKEAE